MAGSRIAEYAEKVNGLWYQPGDEIPADDPVRENESNKQDKETVKEEAPAKRTTRKSRK